VSTLDQARATSKLLREYRNYKAICTRAADTIDALVVEVERLKQDRDEWKESTIMANENARREEDRRRDAQAEVSELASIGIRSVADVQALRAEVERLNQSILDELPTLETLTKRFGEVCAENEKLREALKTIASNNASYALADIARTALLPYVPETNFGNIPDERDNLLNGG
jgi:hypothetical protein